MSTLDELGKAISRALGENPADEVLAVLTGAFVSLAIELVRQNGHDPDNDIIIDGGRGRDITIHAKKGGAA